MIADTTKSVQLTLYNCREQCCLCQFPPLCCWVWNDSNHSQMGSALYV